MTTFNTTRRAILAGVPAAALVATIPGTLKAAPADSAAWERAKADFANACQRFTAASDAYTRADGEQIDFIKTAPECEVIYNQKGWQVTTERAHFEMKGGLGPFRLTRHNYADSFIEEGLKATPEYAAFVAEMEEWHANREALAEARGWNAAEQEWEDALDMRTEAWNALIVCPVETAPQIAEKMALARSVEPEPDEVAKLMDAINADLTRITAH